MSEEEKKRPVGRPPVILDADQIRNLAQRQWTVNEIAAHFGVSYQTVRDNYFKEIEEGRLQGRCKLRDLQWRKAVDGSDRMLIHLGEHYLEQTRKMKLDVGQLPDEVLQPEIERRLNGRTDETDVPEVPAETPSED